MKRQDGQSFTTEPIEQACYLSLSALKPSMQCMAWRYKPEVVRCS